MPQCKVSGCRIHIIDNASPIPISEIVKQHFGEELKIISIVRNANNIGANANICRCFELCNTEWMWLLGDDDMPGENALEIIQSAILEAPESCCMLNFSSNITGDYATDLIRNHEELAVNIRRDLYFSNLLFISSSVYRMKPLRSYISHAYHFAYSCAPQLIPPFLALSNGSSIHNRKEHIVRCVAPAPEGKWNPVYLLLGLITLSDHHDLRPLALNVTRRALKSILGNIRTYVKLFVKNLLVCPDNELRFWSSAYLRIASNVSIADKIALILLSQLACLFRLAKPCRSLVKKALGLNSALEVFERT
jgi:hypothetical protein